MKTIIFHYHFFKNAGTSLDASFKEVFHESSEEWVTKEFPSQPELNREQVKQWIIDNPQATCFSSHTAILPPPKIKGIRIIPVIFFRHPIDRLASAYYFEKKQGGNGFGSILARNTSLAGYIETRLSLGYDRQCRDFHTHRFATMFGEKQGDETTRAKMAVDALPFVGLVEKYSESLEKLETLLESEGFEDIRLQPIEKNVSRDVKKTLDEKIAEIKEQLGEDLFSCVVNANKTDMEIWEKLNNA